MRRHVHHVWFVLAALAAVLSLVGCGEPGPKAFPGSARQKATELVRRLDARGIDHIGTAALAADYGTEGPSTCSSDQSAEERRRLTAIVNAEVDMPPDIAETLRAFEEVTLGVYCPDKL